MASNRELRDEAQALSAQLGEPGVDTSRMNNGQLSELVAGLRRRVEERGAGGATSEPAPGEGEPDAARGGLSAGGAIRAPAGGDESAAPAQPGGSSDVPAPEGPSAEQTAPAPPAPPAPERVRYEVAPRKAITCARGVLGPGAEVFPKDLADGQKQLEHLAALGYLRKTS